MPDGTVVGQRCTTVWRTNGTGAATPIGPAGHTSRGHIVSVPVGPAAAPALVVRAPPRRVRSAGSPARFGAIPCPGAGRRQRRRFGPGRSTGNPDLRGVHRPIRCVPRNRQHHLAVARQPGPGSRCRRARPTKAARWGLWCPPVRGGKMVMHPPRGVHTAAGEPVRPAPVRAHAAPRIWMGLVRPPSAGWGLGGGVCTGGRAL